MSTNCCLKGVSRNVIDIISRLDITEFRGQRWGIRCILRGQRGIRGLKGVSSPEI